LISYFNRKSNISIRALPHATFSNGVIDRYKHALVYTRVREANESRRET